MKDTAIEKMSSIEDENWWHEGRRKILCDIIRDIRGERKDLKILDVGCGPGGTTVSFLEFGTVVGTDFSASALKIASQKGIKNVLKSNLLNPPFKNEIFDVITTLDVIEHINEDVEVLKKLQKLLKSDGCLIITVPAFQFLWSEHDVAVSHVRRYNISTLAKILHNSGFKIVRISYFVSFLFPLVAMYRILKKTNVDKENPKPNMVKFPYIINKILEKIMKLENRLLKKINFPFGTSIICIAKKVDTP